MNLPPELIANLRKSIVFEAYKAMKLDPDGWVARLLSPLIYFPTKRFARLVAEADARVAADGFPLAATWLLDQIVEKPLADGQHFIPREGPVVIASNHPGAFDGLVILSNLPRLDIQMIISDVPFTRHLVGTRPHLIFSAGNNPSERMAAARASVRHLRSGGLLLLFPTGVVDPDPSFMPGAEAEFDGWSDSVEFFIRMVPGVQIVPTIVSGVIGPGALQNPLVRRQPTRRDRQKVAEYLEVVEAMAFGRDLGLKPRLSFGSPLGLEEVAPTVDQARPLVIAAKQLLEHHLITYYSK